MSDERNGPLRGADRDRWYEMARVALAVARWIDAANRMPTEADLWHSVLLPRLLDGYDPLPQPPPRAYSAPWYALIETGQADLLPFEVHRNAPDGLVDGDGFWIRQSFWPVVATHSDTLWEVQYYEPQRTPGAWTLAHREDGTWRLERRAWHDTHPENLA
jgi:hypothetical protein